MMHGHKSLKFNDIPSLYKKLYLNPPFIHKSISDIFQSSKAIFGATQYYKNGVLLMVFNMHKILPNALQRNKCQGEAIPEQKDSKW